MIDLLFEGTESLRLPCSWLLIIPGAAVIIGARRRTVLVTLIFALVAMGVAWLRFAGFWPLGDVGGATQVGLGAGILGTSLIAWRFDKAPTDGLMAAVAGLAGAWAWIPCVGPNLGDVLNGARSEPFAHIGGTVAYMTGLFVPFIVLAAAGVLFPQFQEKTSHRSIVGIGFALMTIVGLLFAVTLFDDLASELARRSTF